MHPGVLIVLTIEQLTALITYTKYNNLCPANHFVLLNTEFGQKVCISHTTIQQSKFFAIE